MQKNQLVPASNKSDKTDNWDKYSNNKPTKSDKKTDKKPKKLNRKGVIYGAVGFVVACFVLIGILFVPVGNQIVLAKTLDALGFHRAALGVDVATNNFRFLAQDNKDRNTGAPFLNLAGANVDDPASCRDLWADTEIDMNTFADISLRTFTEITTVNPDYQDTFYAYANTFSSASLSNQNVGTEVQGEFSVDLDKFEDVKNSLSSDPDFQPGILTGNLGLQVGASSDNINFNLREASFRSNHVKAGATFQLAAPYGGQRGEGSVDEFFEGFKGFFDGNIQDILSDNTGQAFYEYMCASIDTIEVEAPQEVEFGRGELAITREVRPIKIVYKELDTEDYKALARFLQSLSTDESLKSYLKSKYDSAKKVFDNRGALFGSPEASEEGDEDEDESQEAQRAIQTIQTEIDSTVRQLEADTNIQFTQAIPDTPPRFDPLEDFEDDDFRFEDDQQEEGFFGLPGGQELTKEDWDSLIDSIFNGLGIEAEDVDSLAESLESLYTGLTEENLPTNERYDTVYIDMDTKDLYGTKVNGKVALGENLWDSFDQGDFEDVFGDGITYEVVLYDLQFAEEVESLDVPNKVE